MEKSREPLHDQQNCDCQGGESSKYEEEAEASAQTPHAEADVDDHGPEHLRELCQEKGEKRARFRATGKNGGLLQFTYKAKKLESSQLPLQRGGKLKRDNSFCSQVCQDIASNCWPQRRAASLFGSSLLCSELSTPSLPSRSGQLLAEH